MDLPEEEARNRIAALRARLAAAEPPLDAALLVQNVDVYYFSGTFQSAHLLVPARGEPRLLCTTVTVPWRYKCGLCRSWFDAVRAQVVV